MGVFDKGDDDDDNNDTATTTTTMMTTPTKDESFSFADSRK